MTQPANRQPDVDPNSEEYRRVDEMLQRLQRKLDGLAPDARFREVMRVRLQILRNSVRLGCPDEWRVEARDVLLEQIDELADCCGVQLAGGAR